MMWEHWLVQESLEMAVVLLAKSSLTDTDRTRWGQGRMEVKIVDEGQRRHSRQNFLSTIVQIGIILPDPDQTKKKKWSSKRKSNHLLYFYVRVFKKMHFSLFFKCFFQRYEEDLFYIF